MASAPEHYDDGLRNLCKSQGNKSVMWYGQAIRDFSEAIAVDPNLIQAYVLRATCYDALGEPAKATEDRAMVSRLGRATQAQRVADRATAKALCERARHAMDNGGLISDTLFDLQKAIDADPTFADTYDTRSDVYSTLGMAEEALADIKRLGELNVDSSALGARPRPGGGAPEASNQGSANLQVTPGDGPGVPETPAWSSQRGRLAALVTVAPIATQRIQAGGSTGPASEGIRILRWNYARFFAFAWTGLAMFLAVLLKPDKRGEMGGLSLFFLMVGVLYVVFVGLNLTSGSYWRSFFVTSEVPRLPINRLALLTASAGGGLLQVLAAATLIGVFFGLGGLMRR